jgi:hypothetical protein
MAAKKEKHAGGRPTKYDPKYCQEMIDFFDVEYTRAVEKATKAGEIYIDQEANSLPLIVQFAKHIGVARSTLHKWATETDEDGKLKNPEFSNAFACAKDMQEAMLISNGLEGKYQTQFAIFAAKNMIGWRDKQEIDHKSTDKSMTPPATLAAAAMARLKGDK